MVHQIVNSRIFLFLEVLVVALFILFIGFIVGYSVESGRLNKIVDSYKEFEVNALDLKLQDYYFQTMAVASCEKAIAQNFAFADKIYNTGLLIEKYEQSGQLLGTQILNEKKKYVLLKTELWLNSILLKNKCSASFHTIVYFYSQTPTKAQEAEQAAIALTLKQLKDNYGNEFVLLPIAGDLGLDSVSMQMDAYNVTYLPSILIDEKKLIEGFERYEELEAYLK